ncbi:MAG: T9SS type A sorting domain-containing protein [Ignavibacteriae bacterium]|nr:T9SS C-terminal target domain-containing protein [Ignavibacteriota bacterium]NOG97717.1 T9SS type A sorting domain-containing protein [Ignavibacteriota bacterium]
MIEQLKNIFKLFLLTFQLSIITGSLLFSQTLTGTVTDLTSNTRVKNPQIEIINNSNLTRDTVTANSIGNWQYNILTTVDDDNFSPSSFYVAQNYPNPFNPSTKIQFKINSDGITQISVHNVLGQLIDSRSQFLSPGNYSIDWQGGKSAGVYFYTITFNNQSITKKMIQLDGGETFGLSEIRQGINFSNEPLTKSSSFDLSIVTSKLGYISDTINVTISGNQHFDYTLQTVHSAATLIDLHNDVLEVMAGDPNYHLADPHNYNHTDIPRMKIGGVDIQFFAIWVSPYNFPNNPYQESQNMVQIFNAELFVNGNDISQARTLAQAETINESGKIAAVLAVEGGHTIENSIDKLIDLYNDGMRYMTITWNNSTDWAVSAQDADSTTVGLSDFGREVIRTMDSLGIMIDVSHTGIKTIQDILEETTNPIIASHSGARAIEDHYRNLYDSQIVDIANSGGVVGIVFYPPFLGSPSSSVDINTVISHIDHIVNLVGIEYVAIGSDFDGIGDNTVNGLEDVSKFPALTLALLEHGYTRSEVEKILGGNFKRVFEQVCGN